MSSQVKYHALLIGIDAYPDKPLHCCVNNVDIIKEALDQHDSPPVQFKILTATASPHGGLLEGKGDWPTATNVKTALGDLSKKVKKGDRVFIYYSGHGSHIPPPDTLPSTDKTRTLQNELGFVLLDDDLETSTDWPGYEFAKHLQALFEVYHAVVTVVIDCEWKVPEYPSDGWYNHMIKSRNGEREAMWPFNTKGYTVLAAFQADGEIKVGDLAFGKLSYFIYGFILRFGLGEKYRDLYAHLWLKFHNMAAVGRSSVPRTPMLFGHGDQNFFSEDLNIRLVVNAGEAHGLCVGDELLLLPRAALPSGRTRKARPAGIIQTNALTSIFSQRDVDPAGDWVAEPRSRLRLREFPVYLDSSIPDQVGMINTLSASGIFAHGDGAENYHYRLQLVGDKGGQPSRFDILDRSGKSIVGHQLNLTAEEHPEDLADVLLHLVKFSLVLKLRKATLPMLQAKDFHASFDIYVETRSGTRYNPEQLIELQDRNTGRYTFVLHLVNYRDIPLHIYILALGSRWDIRLIHEAFLEPTTDGSDPTRLRKAMRTTVPPELVGDMPCDDIIKVFVTTYPTNLDILLQPTIEERRTCIVTTEQKRQWLTLGPAQPRRDAAVPEQWDAFSFFLRTTRQSKEAEPTLGAQSEAVLHQLHKYAATESSDTFSSHQPDSTIPTTVSENATVDTENAPGDRSFITLFNYKGDLAAGLDELDDIQSLNSVDDDVESRAESSAWVGTYLETAVNFVVHTFTRDPELLALYQQVITGMDTSKFVRNHQRLLRTYFLDLHSHGGSSPSQQIAIWFFRSRSRRARVSSAIHHALTPVDGTMREKIDILVEEDDYALDRYLETIDSASAPIQSIDADAQSDVASQTSTDDEMSGDEVEAGEENDLSKLEATGDFLTAGPPFRLFKQNFRKFLQPGSAVVNSQAVTPDDQEDDDDLPSIGLNNLDYDVHFALGPWSTVWDSTKRGVELIAGCPLSWWPLCNPEDELRANYTRVYSTPAKQLSQQFFDDIPNSLAEKIFPKLLDPTIPKRRWRHAISSHKVVLLRDTTLMRVLQGWRNHSGRGQKQQKAGDQMNLSSQPAKNGSQSSPNQHTPAKDAVERKEKDTANQQSKESIVFMSADMRPNESIACTVDLGANDKTTFQNLQSAHRKFPSWGWKRATGIRFYRVNSRLTSFLTET